MSKYLSGEDDEEEDELEFLRRRSTAASLQNSTHRGVRPPEIISRLLLEKLVDDPAECSLVDRCLERILGSEL